MTQPRRLIVVSGFRNDYWTCGFERQLAASDVVCISERLKHNTRLHALVSHFSNAKTIFYYSGYTELAVYLKLLPAVRALVIGGTEQQARLVQALRRSGQDSVLLPVLHDFVATSLNVHRLFLCKDTDGRAYRILPLAKGFSFLVATRLTALSLSRSLKSPLTKVITGLTPLQCKNLEPIWRHVAKEWAVLRVRAGTVYQFHQGETVLVNDGDTLFLIHHDYISQEVAWQQSHKGRSHHTMCEVTFVGVGTNVATTSRPVMEVIRSSSNVIYYDKSEWVVRASRPRGHLVPVPYDYATFENVISRIDEALYRLAAQGERHITVVVDGNPEIMDIMNYIPPAQNRVVQGLPSPSLPMLSEPLYWKKYAFMPFSKGVTFMTAYTHRHSIARQEFLQHLSIQLRQQETLYLAEAFATDGADIFSLIKAHPHKRLIVAMNLGTLREQLIALPKEIDWHKWYKHTKGSIGLAAFVVYDCRRFPSLNKQALHKDYLSLVATQKTIETGQH